jgi:hypothetical protein
MFERIKRADTAVVVAVATASTTVLLSMVLNAWAFTADLGSWLGYAVGVLVPLWILALTYMGHRAWGVERKLAYASYSLAGFALVVSLPHLAHGFTAWLGTHWWEAWSLAVVTDLTQVVAKMLVIRLVHKAQAPAPAVEQTTPAKRSSRKRTAPKVQSAA